MRSLLERPVSFRLSAESHLKYEAAAAQLGMRLSQYLRFRLETEDSVTDQVSQLRLALLDGLPRPGPSDTDPALVELLLLMRRATSPSELRAVRLELERQGLTPWAPQSD